MKKHFSISLFLVSSICLGLFFASPVSAKKTFADSYATLDTVADKTGHEKVSVQDYIPKVVQAGFAAVGITFLGLMVYAGMKWMTARGNEESIDTARSTLVNATIGLILIVSAYAITSFVTSRLIEGKSAGKNPNFDSTYGDEPLGCCLYQAKAGMLGGGTWGSGIMTQAQCDSWKSSQQNVASVEWDGSLDSAQCQTAKQEKNSVLNKITPDINFGS